MLAPLARLFTYLTLDAIGLSQGHPKYVRALRQGERRGPHASCEIKMKSVDCVV